MKKIKLILEEARMYSEVEKASPLFATAKELNLTDDEYKQFKYLSVEYWKLQEVLYKKLLEEANSPSTPTPFLVLVKNP